MSSTDLNPNVFSSVDILSLAADLTGCKQDSDWDLTEQLLSLGLPFKVADSLSSDAFGRVCDQLRAVFLAGYMVGRNPDLLILGNAGCIFQSERQ